MKKRWLRITTAWRILTGRDRHWVYIHLDRENFEKLVLEDEDFEAQMEFHGMQKYNLLFMLKQASSFIKFEDLVEEKARFEANLDEWIKKL